MSYHRWIIDGKLVYLVNQLGQIVAWDASPDNAFQGLIAEFADEMVILGDTGFHAKGGDPPNLKVCKWGTWNVRMTVESVLAMLTTVCQFKKARYRTWSGFTMELALEWTLLVAHEHMVMRYGISSA